MKIRIIYLVSLLAICAFTQVQAQEKQVQTDTLSSENRIETLKTERERVIELEKGKLKKKVLEIENRLAENIITKEEAKTLKMDAAKATAENIENRTAIIDNQIALLERKEKLNTETRNSRWVFDSDDEDSFLGIKHKNEDDKKEVVYDRRTTSDFVFAIGFNNAIIDGQSFDDTPYKIGGSRFLELGWAWKTRVFDESNWLRFRYGFSFQFNGLKMDNNQYFVERGEQTVLETYPLNLDKSKLRMDNLVFPIFFEFGPSDREDHDDHFRYSTEGKFKMGLGAYGGLNLLTIQKLKYEENGNDRKDKFKQNYNTNNFIYGLSAYVAWGDVAVYAKYDLNTIFKDNPTEQRNISLGLRFDVD